MDKDKYVIRPLKKKGKKSCHVWYHWTDTEDIRLSGISETEKDKHCMISLNVESKKVNLIKPEYRMVVARGCGVGEISTKGHKLLVIR